MRADYISSCWDLVFRGGELFFLINCRGFSRAKYAGGFSRAKYAGASLVYAGASLVLIMLGLLSC